MAYPSRQNFKDKTLIGTRGTRLWCIEVVNGDAGTRYMQCFDAAATGDVTLGTTVPNFVIALDSSGVKALEHIGPFGNGLVFNLGLVVAVTTTATGSTLATNNAECSFVLN